MFINFNLTFNDLKTTISGALNRWTGKNQTSISWKVFRLCCIYEVWEVSRLMSTAELHPGDEEMVGCQECDVINMSLRMDVEIC